MPRGKSIKNKKTNIRRTVNKKDASKKVEDELLVQARIEKDKRLIMWSGVTFFMALILTLWIFNMKTIFKGVESDNQETGFEWRETTDELTQTISEFKKNWDEIKIEDVSTSTASSSDELTKEDITELKLRIEGLETKLNNQE
jgi:hypothetical protein